MGGATLQALMKFASGPGNVALRTVTEPQPGPGQVMIEVQYASICGSDLHIREWDIQLLLRPPVIMGHEFSGHVAALGDGVTDIEVGQAVVSETAFKTCGHCTVCKSGHENVCAGKELIGFVHNGCFARYVVVPVDRIHTLPEGVDLLSAAATEPLACVVHATLELTRITPGDLVVVAGPGTIGLLSLQIAKSAGARVIVTGAGGDEKRLGLAQELGADLIVDVTQQDLNQIVRAESNGEGADIYFECSGAPAAARIGLQVVRRRGQYTQIGLAGAPFEVDFATIAYKELKVTGSLGQKWTAWERALALLAEGKVVTRPLISHVLPLSQWERGFELFESKEGMKVVLTP